MRTIYCIKSTSPCETDLTLVGKADKIIVFDKEIVNAVISENSGVKRDLPNRIWFNIVKVSIYIIIKKV